MKITVDVVPDERGTMVEIQGQYGSSWYLVHDEDFGKRNGLVSRETVLRRVGQAIIESLKVS